MVNGREGVVQWFCPCTALERVNTRIWYFELFTSTVQHVTNSITEAHVPTRDVQNSFEMGRDTASTCYLVGVMLMFNCVFWTAVGIVPSTAIFSVFDMVSQHA